MLDYWLIEAQAADSTRKRLGIARLHILDSRRYWLDCACYSTRKSRELWHANQKRQRRTRIREPHHQGRRDNIESGSLDTSSVGGKFRSGRIIREKA